MRPFKEGFASVRKGETQAIIDAKGNFLVPYGKYLDTYDGFVNGLCRVGIRTKDKNGGWITLYGFINTSGKEVIPCIYRSLTSLSKLGFAYASKVHKQYLLLDKTGRETVMALDPFSAAQMFDPPVPGQEIVTAQGVCDKLGKLKAPAAYEFYHQFSEGLAAVAKRDESGELKWGFIDTNGKTVVPFRYSREPGNFSQGLAPVFPAVQSAFAYGYIDRTGNVTISVMEEDNSRSLKSLGNGSPTAEIAKLAFTSSGIALTLLTSPKGKPIFIDREGKYFTLEDLVKHNSGLSFQSDKTEFISLQDDNIIFTVLVEKIRSKAGSIKTSGNISIPPVFSELSHADSVSGLSYAKVAIDLSRSIFTKGYVNKDGVFVIIQAEASKW
jgi:hypothetical protein